MRECVFDACLAFRDEFLVVEQVAQSQQAVGIIGSLLVSPPVLSLVAIARYLASPEASVVGIGEGFGMSCQSCLLSLEELQEPTLRCDVCNESFLKNKLSSGSKAKCQRCQQKVASLHI